MEFVRSWNRPSELLALLQFFVSQKLVKAHASNSENALSNASESEQKCYHFLNLTSRSFAAVVQALHPSLRLPICIFYLVLRGLDTIEDDMSLDLGFKCRELEQFYAHLSEEGRDWTFDQCAESEKDRVLLLEFYHVTRTFLTLRPEYQEIIRDITLRMGKGMSEFANKITVETVQEWDLYCHYVAGLVGIGLCRMFSVSGLEDPDLADLALGVDGMGGEANKMGLFLQKVNILRDYLEDLNSSRTFWPREVWQKYAPTLEDLATEETILAGASVDCLNELIVNAMQLFPICLTFMSRLQDRSVFEFCAIPQIMALATLSLLLNNSDVFRPDAKQLKKFIENGRVVKDGEKPVGCGLKIRKGQAVYLLQHCSDMKQLLGLVKGFLREMSSKCVLNHNGKWMLKMSTCIARVDQWICEYEQQHQ